MCDFCFDYGAQTVSVRKNTKQVKVCFKCLEEANK